jgi:cytochrome c biogenesis protein CcdA
LLRFGACAPNPAGGLQQRAGGWGLGGAVVLGALFALSFCPVSAALFFGSLIPLAMTNGSSLAMPSLYGVGTGLPVLAFAGVVGFGAQALSRGFQRITRQEIWARRLTGIIFIAVGLYYSLNYIFEAFD